MSKAMQSAESEISELQRKNKQLEVELATVTEKKKKLQTKVSRNGASPISSISKRYESIPDLTVHV